MSVIPIVYSHNLTPGTPPLYPPRPVRSRPVPVPYCVRRTRTTILFGVGLAVNPRRVVRRLRRFRIKAAAFRRHPFAVSDSGRAPHDANITSKYLSRSNYGVSSCPALVVDIWRARDTADSLELRGRGKVKYGFFKSLFDLNILSLIF